MNRTNALHYKVGRRADRTVFGYYSKRCSSGKTMDVAVVGKCIAGLIGFGAVGITAVAIPFLTPALRRVCLPYVPATEEQIGNVLAALKFCPKGPVIDLGSGDGRVAIEMARHHQGPLVGVEMNPWLVGFSRLKSYRANTPVKFIRKDFFKLDLRPYQTVVIFGTETLMADLQPKLMKELSLDANIIACRFPLDRLQHSMVVGEGIDRVWLYRKDSAEQITTLPTSNETYSNIV